MVKQNPDAQHAPGFDRAGFIRDPAQWSEALALQIALRDGLPELTRAHWLIIRALREHYCKFGVAPPLVSHLCTANHLDRHCVDDLFRDKREAWRIAGLPDPGEEVRSYL